MSILDSFIQEPESFTRFKNCHAHSIGFINLSKKNFYRSTIGYDYVITHNYSHYWVISKKYNTNKERYFKNFFVCKENQYKQILLSIRAKLNRRYKKETGDWKKAQAYKKISFNRRFLINIYNLNSNVYTFNFYPFYETPKLVKQNGFLKPIPI